MCTQSNPGGGMRLVLPDTASLVSSVCPGVAQLFS